MHIKVTEVSFKETPHRQVRPYPYDEPVRGVEAAIEITVDGKDKLRAVLVLSPEAAAYRTYESIMATLRRQVMAELEKKLFNDFNMRTADPSWPAAPTLHSAVVLGVTPARADAVFGKGMPSPHCTSTYHQPL